MSDQTTGPTQPHGLLQKRITLKWTLILLGAVVIAGAILWAIKAVECGSIARNNRTELTACANRAAENMARAIAVVGNRQIVEEEYDKLQDYADALVKDRSVAYIAIVGPSGKAVVHTNRSLLGETWTEPKGDSGVVTASAKVMDFTDQVATIYVGVTVQ